MKKINQKIGGENMKNRTERNINIDILRALSILLIVVYHIYASTNIEIHIPIIRSIIQYGGEIGVTTFLILSGFSIQLSLNKTSGKIPYKDFIKNRFRRLAPEYYFCIVTSLFLMGGAVYLSKDHIKDILTHVFFIHNIFISTHGSINGVLWTLGVIFQFYLIAKIIYKLLEKNSIVTLIASMLITIGSKILIFRFLYNTGSPSIYLFIYGRQLITALDNFVMGMFLCKAYQNQDRILGKSKYIYGILGCAIFVIAMGIPSKYPIYSNSLVGYTYHTLLAISITFLFYSFLNLRLKKNWIVNSLGFISKYEYGIYLWHLIIINNLIAHAPVVINLIGRQSIMVYILLFIVSVGLSLLLSIIFNNSINYMKLKKSKS